MKTCLRIKKTPFEIEKNALRVKKKWKPVWEWKIKRNLFEVKKKLNLFYGEKEKETCLRMKKKKTPVWGWKRK